MWMWVVRAWWIASAFVAWSVKKRSLRAWWPSRDSWLRLVGRRGGDGGVGLRGGLLDWRLGLVGGDGVRILGGGGRVGCWVWMMALGSCGRFGSTSKNDGRRFFNIERLSEWKLGAVEVEVVS